MFAPNFTKHELTNSNTANKNGIDNEPPEKESANLERLSWFLQALKMSLIAHLGTNVSIIVSSGYRCPALNKLLSGSKTSAHMKGLAADITCSHLTPLELAKFIETNMKAIGYDQVIQEHTRWVHIGLPEISFKLEPLTATNLNGATIYSKGIH